MSKEIDWSMAPEGATHYTNATDDYYAAFWRNDNGKAVELWVVHPSGDIRHVKDPYPSTSEIDRMIEIPKSWAGTGLPPVGTVCEAQNKDGNAWEECEVIAHSEISIGDVVVFKVGDKITYSSPKYFRPIRTQAQIEAEEREKAVSDMLSMWMDCGSARDFCEYLHDHGYRKTEAGK